MEACYDRARCSALNNFDNDSLVHSRGATPVINSDLCSRHKRQEISFLAGTSRIKPVHRHDYMSAKSSSSSSKVDVVKDVMWLQFDHIPPESVRITILVTGTKSTSDQSEVVNENVFQSSFLGIPVVAGIRYYYDFHLFESLSYSKYSINMTVYDPAFDSRFSSISHIPYHIYS